ncbi:hypothetical protein [Maledivibacter halophilus]|uniref:Lipoprotein n=1 Tax=Maledivibacter halophilus TaxID=36842 RepID=A0A1T5ICQ6_9FIRM|nr:hypothetical protein [Maledivibacter halophilus]SKC36782.1 hypothetical protein SAMN02194393_00197 [Maledivibacter halophilus]
MKKIISLLLVLLLSFTFFGCSKEISSQKTEEELRAEIKAEMEEEAKRKEELKEEMKKEMEGESEDKQEENAHPSKSLDVRNNDELYKFINSTYPNKYNREDFDKWNPFYFDITGDGNDEVSFTSTYSEGNLENAIFITADNGEYRIISSDIVLSKYKNDLAYNEGFITIAQKAGGSGMFLEQTSYFVYDGEKIKSADAFIVTEDVVAHPKGYIIKGEIEGDPKNFVYTATKEDYATEKTSVIEKTKYVYNPETMKFDKEIIIKKEDNEEGDSSSKKQSTEDKNTKNQEVKNDYTKGFDYEVRDGNVYVKYKNTGNEIEVYNPKTTTIHKDDGNGLFTFKSGEVQGAIARTASQGNNGKRVYFTTNEYDEYVRNAYSTFYVDMATLKVYFVANGEYIKHITDYPYNNYTIIANEQDGSAIYSVYDSANQFACYLGGDLSEDIVAQIASAVEKTSSDAGLHGLSSFKKETIGEEEIDYSKYIAVVIPMHSTSNIDSLTKKTCSFSDNPNNQKVIFSVFGEMKDIKITYFENMDSKGEVENIDKLKNFYLEIYAPFGTDMSSVKVTGKVHIGEGYYEDVKFTLDDMRDTSEYEILKYE